MTSIREKDRDRVVFVSNGGDDNDNGKSECFSQQTLATATATAAAQTPTIADPVLIRGLDGSRYVETFSPPDYTRVNMEDASITGAVELPESAYVKLASVVTLTGVADQNGVTTNGKSQTSIEAFGIFTNGTNNIGYDISGTSSDVFCRVGQIAVNADDSIGLNYTSSGTPRRLSVNEINLGNIFTGTTPTNCEGIHYETTNPSALGVEGSSITQNGTGNMAIHVVDGRIVTLIPDIEMGADTALHIEVDGVLSHQGALLEGEVINDGQAQVFSQKVTGDWTITNDFSFLGQEHDGDITHSSGDFNYSCQKATGDYTITGAVGQLHVQELTGDITVSGLSTAFIDCQLMQGDIANNTSGSILAYSTQGHTGDINLNEGNNLVSAQGVVGSINADAGINRFNVGVVTNDFTVGASADCKGYIAEVQGTITIDPAATLGMEIDGIKYGSWEDTSANNYALTFLRDGTIPTSYETVGTVTIDTTTDSVDPSATTTGVQGSYEQTTGASRTVNFRLIDADNATIYYSGSNVSAGASVRRYVDLTLQNALPSNQVVRMLFQAQRSGAGGGVNGAGGLIEIKRV